jgi:hypothetical protein
MARRGEYGIAYHALVENPKGTRPRKTGVNGRIILKLISRQ